MKDYVILPNPGHNRIYFDAAMDIAKLELAAMLQSVGIKFRIKEETDEVLPKSIYFSSEVNLDETILKIIGQFSMYYALFEIKEEGLLKPIKVPDFHTFPESMTQILRYSGKTNEQFTRLMVNLALSACKTKSLNKKLIDPMCGKGTTLYEGLVRGFNVVGMDLNGKWIQETRTFVLRYLKEGKYKHNIKDEKRTLNGKKIADVFTLETAIDKKLYNEGKVQNMQVFVSDARNINTLIKKESCDMLVTDLPYGVQHGSKTEGTTSLCRSPLDLVMQCSERFYNVLKPNGAMVLSFNQYTLKYEDIAKALEKSGFIVLNEYPYYGYAHRVDQAINRNIIVVQKP